MADRNEKHRDNSSGLLDVVYESLRGNGKLPRSEVGVLTTNKFTNLENIIGAAPFNAWLLNDAQVSDESILLTTTKLTSGSVDPAVIGYFDRSVQGDDRTGALYLRMIKSLCREVRKDVNENKGEKFRWIIKNTQLGGINDVVTIPEIKNWLFEEHENTPTVYDLEDAVVKATILHTAGIYAKLIRNQGFDTPRSVN